MAFEVFQASFLLITALTFLYFSQKGQPWAAGITGILFTVIGWQLFFTGFQYPTGLTESVNQSNTYGNFTVNASAFNSLGILQSWTVSNENLITSFNQTATKTIGYNTTKDNFTGFLGAFFTVLGVILVVLSIFLAYQEMERTKKEQESDENT